jgi:GT2 family glycosyltransferase
MADRKQPQSVSVIIPVHNGGDDFKECLKSLSACDPAPKEIIVVADGYTDGSWRFAEELGQTVLRREEAGGPAAARNLGAGRATGDILFFVDADVTVPGDAVGRVAAAFDKDPAPGAVFGSYDDRPARENFLSQYKNLLHHYVHQTSREDAATFWAGCGAVRREAFMGVGGFKETYRHPSIEDIELGGRLRGAGFRIRLDKGLQARHLKRWTLRSLLRADILYRALPWTDLILRGGSIPNDLNLKLSSRVSAACSCLLVLALALSPFFPSLPAIVPVLVAVSIFLDRRLYAFFKEKRGLWFALRSIPMTWFYYVYSSLAFAFGYLRFMIHRRPRPGG